MNKNLKNEFSYLVDKTITNRVKHNYYKSLYSGEFDIDYDKFKNRIVKDFKLQNIDLNDSQIDNLIYGCIKDKRWELMDYLF